MSEVATPVPAGREFRSDINGLRAWAVVAVVLYHFGVPGISSGFSGVDVFFVISGFLMTGIILSGLERGQFSIWQFYLARARRIFPALLVLCVVTLVFGWFLLMPEEYQQLGRHARESLTFTSNLRYFDESGYFDVASQEKWLLHTWSLSVEWQFYLALPLLLALVWKFCPGRRAALACVLLVFFGSLAWCLWRTPGAPSEAFFLIQTRAWEMLAGGLVLFAGMRLRLGALAARLLEGLGIALILVGIVLFDTQSPWPGWRALVPVTGAALVLLAARQGSLWTGTWIAQWLGTRSYSIYLWHWPLVVALAYLERLGDPLWIAGGLVLSLLLGHLSFVLVEGPTRRRLSRMSARQAAAALLLTLLVIALVAQQVRRSGFPDRLPDAIARVEAERENHNPRIKECLDPEASCIYGEAPVRAILIGDSHADAVVTALQAALPAGEGGVLFRGGSGCPIAFGLKTTGEREECELLNRQLEQEHGALPAGVPMVLVSRLTEYLYEGGLSQPRFYFSKPHASFDEAYRAEFRERYLGTLCSLGSKHPLYVMRPIPEMQAQVPTALGRAMLLGKTRDLDLPVDLYRQRHAFVWALQDEAVERCGVRLLDPLPYLCEDGKCRATEDGRPLYRDADHLSEFGNRRLLPLFRQVFAPAAEAERAAP